MRARRLLAMATALGAPLGLAAALLIGAVPAHGAATPLHAATPQHAATPLAVRASAPTLASTASDPLSCDVLGGGQVADVVDPTLTAIDDTVTLVEDFSGFDAARFTDLGGTACTWSVGQAVANVTFAYAPIDDEQAAAAIGDLEAAGLVRVDTSAGVRLSSSGFDQAGPLDGEHLIADDYWVTVRQLSIGSGGYFIVPSAPADAEALRDRVLLALPPAPSPTATPTSAAQAPPSAPAEEAEPVLAADEASVLSGLTPAGAAPVTVASVASTAGTAVVLAALLAIPNRLVDMTAGALADRARRRSAAGATSIADRIRHLMRRVERALHPVAGIAIGLVAAGALTALIDPRAGATIGTLRLAASATLGYAIEGLLGLLLVAWMLRRDGASVGVRFRPVSLLIVLGAIVVSRIVGFEPGFVFGIVLALIFLRPSPTHEQRAALLELGYLAALGVAAWMVYSVIQVNAPPTGPLGLLGVETLAGLTIGCLMALPLLLSPVGALPGRALWRRSRMLWAGMITAAMALVIWVVMPFPAAWDAVHTPVVAWVVLLAVYSVVAAALWATVTRPWDRADASAAPTAPRQPPAIDPEALDAPVSPPQPRTGDADAAAVAAPAAPTSASNDPTAAAAAPGPRPSLD
ncbi:hypothetical protein [Agrococcus sp. ProA11]|uniref:hypothetical protein n=1 Tax=Agrococcus chionoecetis TaxID=3153752 RepID=UPI00326063E4